VVFAGTASAQRHGGGHGGGGGHSGGPSHGGGGSSHGGPSRGGSWSGGHGGGHGGGPSHGSWNGGRDNHFSRGGPGRDVVIVNRGPRYSYGYRRPYYYGPSLALGFGLGYGLGSYSSYDNYYDSYYDGYSLYPGECRTDYRWDYWSGRPAEIALRICADSYGRTYVVRDSRRWVRWR
jgi:hypothetical protein